MNGLTAAMPVRTLQAGQIVRGRALRHAAVAETTTIPPLDASDITLVVSTARPPEADSYTTGLLHAAGDKVVLLEENWGHGHFVTRRGDQFIMDQADDLKTLRHGAFHGAHVGYYTEYGNAQAIQIWHTNRQLCVLSDTLAVAHRSLARNVGGITDGTGMDQFMALELNVDGETGEWFTEEHSLSKNGTYANLGLDGTYSTTSPYSMCRLDDTHFAIIGRSTYSTGMVPFIYIIEYLGDGLFDPHGPWTIGAMRAEGGFEPTNEATMIPLAGNRLLALWFDEWESDLTGKSYSQHRQVLHAQILSYNLGSHTATAGPLCRFQAGIDAGDGETRHIYFPDEDLVFLFGINWNQINDFDDPTSAHYVGGDEHIGGRSLIIQGDTVLPGAIVPLAYANHNQPNWDSYWYGLQIVGAGDRVALLWSDVGDNGGYVRYTKCRLGLTGAERGAIGVYDEGVLVGGAATDFEMWADGGQVQLPTGEGLAAFIHYTDNYDSELMRFVLAKEPA